jgi:hypothetical protein
MRLRSGRARCVAHCIELRRFGIRHWADAHADLVARVRVASWLAWNVLMLILVVFSGHLGESGRLLALTWAIWLSGNWLVSLCAFGSGSSLRDENNLADTVVLAEIVGVPIPAHVPWWHERLKITADDGTAKPPFDGRMPLWPAVVAPVAGSFLWVFVPIDSDWALLPALEICASLIAVFALAGSERRAPAGVQA